MTNVSKKKKTDNVHLHIEKAFAVIDEYLPWPYVDKVKKYVDKSPGTIKNVRYKRSGNIQIVEALLKVSLANKRQIERENKKLENLINQ